MRISAVEKTGRSFPRFPQDRSRQKSPQKSDSGTTEKMWKKGNQFLALMLELMSRMVADMSGLVFIRSSIFRTEERTVAWFRSSNW